MPLAAVAFVLAFAAVMGGYLAVTRLPGTMARRQLDERLSEVSTDRMMDGSEPGESTVVQRPIQGPMPAVDRFVSGTAPGSWLARLIEQSGTRTTPSAMILIAAAVAGGVGLVALLFTRQPLIAIGVGLVAGTIPFGWLKRRRTVRLRRFEEDFPEALDLLARAVRAGHAFQTALKTASDELPDPVGPELKKTFEQQNFGLPLREALNQLSDRVPILDVRFFVTAVQIQRETGGNLAEILDNLAHVVRERFKVLRQVRVHTAHGRFTGYVLLAVPPFLAITLSTLNHDHMALLFHERLGQQMLVGALVLQTIGFFWIRKVINIEV